MSQMRARRISLLPAAAAAGVVVSVGLSAVRAGVPDYDFDWVTIGDVANPAYAGPPGPQLNYPVGRGGVGYTYRIARTEVTTRQWMEFMNTFTTQPGVDAFSREWFSPVHWGAIGRNNPSGPGIRFDLLPRAGAAEEPVAGIGWRQAAWYCNWLHNNKSSDLSALVTGAYDTTTWGGGSGTGLPATDAERHLPGARFWIPTIDEWIKAAHYDPDRHGPGAGGWWNYPNRSDVQPVPGLPGFGQTSAETYEWRIPVGSYPQTRSAYGLLDLSGGATEWLEDIFERGAPGMYRRFAEGTSVLSEVTDREFTLDQLGLPAAGEASHSGGSWGLRVVSVPGPGAAVSIALGSFVLSTPRRRSSCSSLCRPPQRPG